MVSHMIPCREGRQYSVSTDPTNLSRSIYITCWLSLMADSPSGLKPIRLVRKFHHALLADYDGISVAMYQSVNLIFNQIRWDSRGELTLDLSGIPLKGSPVARELIQLAHSFDPFIYQYVATFLNFGKKAPTGDNSYLLSAKALRAWYDLETKLGGITLSDKVVEGAKTVLQLLLRPYYVRHRLPVHGSGAVAEKGIRTPNGKSGYIRGNPKVLRYFQWDGKVTPAYLVPLNAHIDGQNSGADGAVWRDYARREVVPKDITSVRTICMEPAEFQWAQQSVRYDLEEALRRSPLGRFVRISDQGFNRDAARAASKYGHLDTIDLSSASDSVSLELIRRIFPNNVLHDLLATRSSGVEVQDGESIVWITVNKFAPMGSAVCFPVETLVFLSVILVAYHHFVFGDDTALSVHSVRELMSLIEDDPSVIPLTGLGTIRAYGDDLIIDSRITDKVISYLESCGFSINRKKSFYKESPFRESCGGFYVHGADVTPFSLKIKEVKGRYITPDLLDGLIQAANRLYAVGYMNTREAVLKFAHCLPQRSKGRYTPIPRPLYYDTTGIHGSPSLVAPEGTKTRYVRDFQRTEGRFVVASSDKAEEGRDDHLAYCQWMRSPGASLTTSDGSKVLVDTQRKLKWVWKPI